MNKTKEAIYEASVDVFSQSGYTGAAMDEIAERAKVAKGTLYYHFKSKEDLFLFVMQTGLGHMIDDARLILEKPLPPEEKIAGLCKSQLRVVRKNENFVKVILSQLFGQEERQRLLRGKLNEYAQLIRECIGELRIEKGTEKRDRGRGVRLSRYDGLGCRLQRHGRTAEKRYFQPADPKLFAWNPLGFPCFFRCFPAA